jgi:hypothetical protein
MRSNLLEVPDTLIRICSHMTAFEAWTLLDQGEITFP